MRRPLALFLLLGLSLAQVRFLPAPGLEGAPGAYLTFSLRVEGEEGLVQVGDEERRRRIGTFRANLAEWPEEPR